MWKLSKAEQKKFWILKNHKFMFKQIKSTKLTKEYKDQLMIKMVEKWFGELEPVGEKLFASALTLEDLRNFLHLWQGYVQAGH